MESNFDFHWHRGQAPWLTLPDGTKTQLKVENRVPVWPMGYDGIIGDSAEIACPTFEDNSSGSSEVPGEPVPVSEEHDAGPEPQDFSSGSPAVPEEPAPTSIENDAESDQDDLDDWGLPPDYYVARAPCSSHFLLLTSRHDKLRHVRRKMIILCFVSCLLYTSDAADE